MGIYCFCWERKILKRRTSSNMWHIACPEAAIGATCPKATFHVSGCVTANAARKAAAPKNYYELPPQWLMVL